MSNNSELMRQESSITNDPIWRYIRGYNIGEGIPSVAIGVQPVVEERDYIGLSSVYSSTHNDSISKESDRTLI